MKQMKHLKQYLFCPGPVNVAETVKQAAIAHEIGHREPEFSDLMQNLTEKAYKMFEIKNTKKYYPVFISGSGTAANETVLSSVVGKKHILVVVNGEFGERLYEISKIHNPHTKILHFGWGEKVDIKKLESYLKAHRVDIIAMVHHETSSGMLNPIVKVGALAKKYNALYFVDTVSSAGADKIEIEKAHITFCSTSASKALGSLPGVSLVIGERREIEKTKDIPVRIMYLNLYKFYHYSTEKLQTPNTPAVHMFFALDQALDNLIREGVSLRQQKLKALAGELRSGMKKLGLSFLIDESDMSSVLTTVLLPESIKVEQLQAKLREKDIIIYNGKGPFQNKVFQVGNIGEFCSIEVEYFLTSLKEAMLALDSNVLPTTTSKDSLKTKKRQPIQFPSLLPPAVFSPLKS